LKEQAEAHPEFSWTALGSGPLFDWVRRWEWPMLNRS
jgi:hypothetical protein